MAACHNKLSPDQYHMTISWAQVKSSFWRYYNCWPVTGLSTGLWVQVMLFLWERTREYSQRQMSAQINPKRIVEFLLTFSLHIRLLESPWYVAYIISTILVTLIGYRLIKSNLEKIHVAKPHPEQWVKWVRTKTKLQWFVCSHWSLKGPISHPQIAIRYWLLASTHSSSCSCRKSQYIPQLLFVMSH